MSSNASIRGNLLYVLNEDLKIYLESKGFSIVHTTKVNKNKAWVFERNETLLDSLKYFNADVKDKSAVSDRLNFIV